MEPSNPSQRSWSEPRHPSESEEQYWRRFFGLGEEVKFVPADLAYRYEPRTTMPNVHIDERESILRVICRLLERHGSIVMELKQGSREGRVLLSAGLLRIDRCWDKEIAGLSRVDQFAGTVGDVLRDMLYHTRATDAAVARG